MAMNPLYATELEMIDGLDEMLYNEGLENKEELKQRFAVTDLASLNWAMRKLTAIEAKKREIRAMIDGEKERLEMFFERETSGLTDSENFFKELVSQYATRKRNEDPKFKSEKTPFGSIGFRKQQPMWLYDEELLIAFLEANDHTDLIRTKKEPVKTEIKKIFNINDGNVYDTNGQKVDGITIESRPDALDIKISEV